MSFQIHALPQADFAWLAELTDEQLRAHRARRVTVDHKPGYPCRVSMADAEVGETVILVHYEHQPKDTPFRASHAVYVRPGVAQAHFAPGEIPELLTTRLLSVRAFDADHDIIDADVTEGHALATTIERMFRTPAVRYLHIHNAKPGCFAARVSRAAA